MDNAYILKRLYRDYTRTFVNKILISVVLFQFRFLKDRISIKYLVHLTSPQLAEYFRG